MSDHNLRKEKKVISAMFNDIASKYDFLNHLLSFGIDKIWRKKLVKRALAESPATLLDIATGTGDLAFTFAKHSETLNITGIDISVNMLDIAKEKSEKIDKKKQITFMEGDALEIPFADNSFDAITVAFGVRNFENLNSGLKDILRVLKPGGQLLVLEFSKPRVFPVKQIYYLYFRFMLPFVGWLVSGNGRAYKYLFESAMSFPEREGFINELKQAGFANADFQPVSFGIASIYFAKKN